MTRAEQLRRLTDGRYYEAAQEYLRYLRDHRPEHFMEGTPSATQREITLESLRLVRAQRPEVQTFNELLVQYPGEAEDEILRVVPDNMVVIHPEPLGDLLSFNYPTQDARPFWMLEYVSTDSRRKDYEENFGIYERLRVPYYLIFYPQTRDLSLYRLNKEHRYVSVKPGANGRYPVRRLAMEVAILDGWVRFWLKGELLPLPTELLDQLQQARTHISDLEAEVARLRAQLGQQPSNGSAS